MTHQHRPGPEWRKSSYSGDGCGECVEFRVGRGDPVAVRDSKAPARGALAVPPRAWAVFLRTLRD
ncbi:hypothetical protein GCM10010218_17850 [Streptomyces mashuensis]|uniref:DUF397 domain-containing protein n=1 Tax=Streptomyces mashuensis TaxID=33904 RepID=A0A919B0F9_9ACTN|nr:DUF397 domain-containing protein [Streptomyces mashuensis]GHF36734.1 hypothetical protein GCM10010218_17850 [Streptomyces mashuensis]